MKNVSTSEHASLWKWVYLLFALPGIILITLQMHIFRKMQKSIERYHYLMEHHADLVRRVPSKYLASYLGIREEPLSRMRGKI